MQYIIIERNEDTKTFRFFAQYGSLELAKKVLDLYLSEIRNNEPITLPRLSYEIVEVQE